MQKREEKLNETKYTDNSVYKQTALDTDKNSVSTNINKVSTTNVAILFAIAIALILIPEVAEAARLDMSKTQTAISSFSKGIGTLCGVVATVMAIYTGFKFYKGGSPLADLTTNFLAIAAFATAGAVGQFVSSLNIG